MSEDRIGRQLDEAFSGYTREDAREVLVVARQTGGETSDAVRAALARGEQGLPDLIVAVHRLANVAGVLQQESLTRALNEVERAARRGDTAKAQHAWSSCERDVEVLIERVQARIDEP